MRLIHPARLKIIEPAFAMTIHKSQGITAHEGSIGLAFVAWTRATTFKKVAFQSIPPLEDFVAVRLSREFQLREEFETKADDFHDAFLKSRGIAQDKHLAAHLEHLEQHMQTKFQKSANQLPVCKLTLRAVSE